MTNATQPLHKSMAKLRWMPVLCWWANVHYATTAAAAAAAAATAGSFIILRQWLPARIKQSRTVVCVFSSPPQQPLA